MKLYRTHQYLLFLSVVLLCSCVEYIPVFIPDETPAIARVQVPSNAASDNLFRINNIFHKFAIDGQNNLFVFTSSELRRPKFPLYTVGSALPAGYETNLIQLANDLTSTATITERYIEERGDIVSENIMQVAISGHIYIAEHIAGKAKPGTDQLRFYRDISLSKISADGAQQWMRRIDAGAGDSDDRILKFDIDGLGRLVLTVALYGGLPDSNWESIATIYYDQEGNKLFQHSEYSFVDPAGNLYSIKQEVSVHTYATTSIAKYTSIGTLLWEKETGGRLRNIEFDDLGQLYLTFDDNTIYVQKWDTNGQLLWQWDLVDLDSDIRRSKSVLSSGGMIYLVFERFVETSPPQPTILKFGNLTPPRHGTYSILVTKINQNGVTHWEHEVASWSSGDGMPSYELLDVVFDSKDRIYISAYARSGSRVDGSNFFAYSYYFGAWTSTVVLDTLGSKIYTIQEPNYKAEHFIVDSLDNFYMLGYDSGYLQGYGELFQNMPAQDITGNLIVKHNVDQL